MPAIHKRAAYNLEAVNFIVGAAVLTFELIAARIVTPYIGNTIYTWTSIIGVILAALALGYWYGGKYADIRRNKQDITVLLVAAALLLLILNITKDYILRFVISWSLPLQVEAFFAGLLLFAAPTVLLGAISPYLARLSITTIKTSGQKVARMSAFGTIGSLFGTFLTGYVLFGYLGTRLILYWLTVCLLLTSFLISRRRFLVLRVVLIVAALLLMRVSPPATSSVIKDIDTKYSRIAIQDQPAGGRTLRLLQNDRGYSQSGEFLDTSDDIAFSYVRAFAYLSKLRPDAKKSLVIGGGAYSTTKYLAHTYPKQTVDTVEIDGSLLNISKQYFNFKQTANMRMITEDGRYFLNTNRTKYDLVYMDAFAPHIPPFQLVTKEAAAKLRMALTPRGIFIANVVAARNDERFKVMLKTYNTAFAHVKAFPVAARPVDDIQNIIVIASNNSISREDLLRIARTKEEASFATNFYTPDTHGALVMTDDFAPIERLSGVE